MAFATPTELKAQFIMPMSYERGRIRLQAQQKEASPPYRLVADLPFLSLCAASSPRPDWGGVRNVVVPVESWRSVLERGGGTTN